MRPLIHTAATDQDLARLAPHDRDAFGELYQRYAERIFAYVRYRVNDRATADDLTAAAFTRALDRIQGFDTENGTFAGWLFTLTRNLIHDHHRRRARWRWLPLDRLLDRPDRTPTPDLHLEGRQRREQLMAAATHLSERERDVLGLRFGAGHTNREIATITGLSESNVGVIVHRALGRMRDQLKGTEVDHD